MRRRLAFIAVAWAITAAGVAGGYEAHQPVVRTVWPVHCVVTTVMLPDGGSGPVLACPLWKVPP